MAFLFYTLSTTGTSSLEKGHLLLGERTKDIFAITEMRNGFDFSFLHIVIDGWLSGVV